MAQTVFNRYEKKYLLPEAVYLELQDRLRPYMQPDRYSRSTVCNIYYDTPDFALIRRSIEKPVYKEKLRLRSYGTPTPDSTVFLEIKKKYKKIVNKRRICLTLRQAYDYLERGIRPPEDSQILREIDYFLDMYRPLQRGVYLAYDRLALAGRQDKDFRVTFDRNIRSRTTEMGLECGDSGKLLLPPDYYLMESKILGAAPLWFSEILTDLSIFPVSFSKYGNIYKDMHGAFHFEDLMRNRYETFDNRRKQIC